MAQACVDNKITFVGPSAENITMMGDKLEARKIARGAGVPLVPGSDHARNPHEAAPLAKEIGYPLLLKASAGGGGRGIKLVWNEHEIEDTFRTAAAEARAAFGNDTLYMERYVGNARHIEVQILGDQHGNVIHLGERDCSLQRRHQKIVEEAPAYAVPAEVRAQICNAAATLARSIGYQSAGTIEFIYDNDTRAYYFLEMNTRIQVEHPVTEMITGVDLVAQQLRIARGEPLPFKQSDINFQRPRHRVPHHRRIAAAWLSPLPRPDLQLAGTDRAGHSARHPLLLRLLRAAVLRFALGEADRSRQEPRRNRPMKPIALWIIFTSNGIDTLIPFLKVVIADAEYRSGKVNTRWLEKKLEEYSATITG